MVNMPSPLTKLLHLPHRESQETIWVFKMLVLKDVDDGLFRAPYVELVTANALASLQNHLLCLVILSHENFLSITSCISRDLVLNMLCELQVLVDFTAHFLSC